MYQIIKNPITVKTNPPILNWLSFIVLIFSNMFFIFDGNKAYKTPSIKKKRPSARISSLMSQIYWFVLSFILPKNLKNSLSGDIIKDVSPPIRAVS